MTQFSSSQASLCSRSQWPFEREFTNFRWLPHDCTAVSALFPRQCSVICLHSKWRVGSKEHSVFSSWQKQICLSRCSVLFNIKLSSLKNMQNSFDSLRRVDVCIKVQGDHKFQRNKWREFVLRLSRIHWTCSSYT